MEDEGNFLRRSVNDITSLLDINFGSLGRPTRGGRGRGARGGPSRRPESVKPILERVCLYLGQRSNENAPTFHIAFIDNCAFEVHLLSEG